MITLELGRDVKQDFHPFQRVFNTNKLGVFYKEPGTDGAQYSRLVGGLAWPKGTKPGFGVVIAEERNNSSSNERKYRVLDENEDDNLERLLEWVNMLAVCSPSFSWCWYGDIKDHPAMEFVWKIKERYPGQELFSLSRAPHGDDPKAFEYYHAILTGRLNPKLLNFGPSSRIPGCLLSINPKTESIHLEDFPPIAALGYGLDALVTWSDTGYPVRRQ